MSLRCHVWLERDVFFTFMYQCMELLLRLFQSDVNGTIVGPFSNAFFQQNFKEAAIAPGGPVQACQQTMCTRSDKDRPTLPYLTLPTPQRPELYEAPFFTLCDLVSEENFGHNRSNPYCFQVHNGYMLWSFPLTLLSTLVFVHWALRICPLNV